MRWKSMLQKRLMSEPFLKLPPVAQRNMLENETRSLRASYAVLIYQVSAPAGADCRLSVAPS